jgi:hypothetical protein
MAYRNGPKITTDGLVLCLDAAISKSYPGSGTTWYDLSGNGHNGTLVNGVGFNSGERGSMTFDGTNDRINFATSPKFDFGTGNFSIQVWYNIQYHTTYHHFWTFGNQYHFGFKVARPDAYDPNIYLYNSSAGGTGDTISAIATLDKWQMASAVRDGDNVSIYIDADNKGTKTGWLNANIDGSTYAGAIGWGNASEYTKGNIAQVKIFNKALSSNEVRQNFNATRGRFGV